MNMMGPQKMKDHNLRKPAVGYPSDRWKQYLTSVKDSVTRFPRAMKSLGYLTETVPYILYPPTRIQNTRNAIDRYETP